jgi:3-oxoacyl-[acyl-carrier-protein] synthase III
LKARIVATGSYLPKKVLSNQDLEQMVDTSDEWIVTRTGIKERRIAEKDQASSDMGVLAAKDACVKAFISPDQIDMILVATLTPDYVFPSTACIIQKQIGAMNASAMDIQAACTGYLYALSLAKAMVENNTAKNVLIVATEKLSSIVDYEDRATCVLFGDGAAACIVSNRGKGLFIENIELGACGEQAELMLIPGGGSRTPATKKTIEDKLHFIKMSGKEVFKHAVRRMESASKKCLENCNLNETDIQWVIAHQANERIIDAVSKRFSHLSEHQIYKTVHKYGNTSASSIGIALDELWTKESIQNGDRILLTAFGAGLTWGACILQSQSIEG